MSAAKAAILDRVRAAIGARREDPAIPREYRQSPSMPDAARIELLADRLHDYNAGVFYCAESDIAGAIAEALSARGKRRLGVPAGFPAAWLPEGFDFVRDEGLSHAEIDGCDGAVTSCEVAIAITGSIVLSHSAAAGRRALTLIPDYHLCIVRADQVVETVPEAIRALRGCRTRPITTIAGPSATADIEMTRVKGVHGPRTLDVIIVAAA